MTDIFYFRSPRKATSVPRRSPISRGKGFITKRRRPGSMETFNPHACMARFDEPTFCPSDVSAILARYSLPLASRSGPTSLPVPDLLEDNDDGDDHEDDSGGVPLTPQQAEPYVPRISPGSHLPNTTPETNTSIESTRLTTRVLPRHDVSVSQPVRTHPGQGEVRTNDRHQQTASMLPRTFAAPPMAARSVLGSSHPRPVTQELWVEEDSRRLRFALYGFDTSEVPRFLVPDSVGISSEHSNTERSDAPERPGPNDPSQSRRSSMFREDASPDSSGQRPQPRLRWPASYAGHSLQGSQASQHDPQSGLHVTGALGAAMLADDEWLAVDDPRRNYDFADFMDDWRLQSLLDKRMTPFEPGVQPSIRLYRPPDLLTRDVVAAKPLDMQGIRWDLIGPRRKDALAARVQLRKDSVNTPVLAPVLEPPPSSILEEETLYRFRSFTPRHRAQSTHYQLRNVLAASSRSDVFYSSGTKVHRTSLACPSLRHTVIDLSKPTNITAGFRVTCLAASPSLAGSGQFLIAGGFCGEYALINVDHEIGTSLQEGFITHAWNGLVTHIHTFTGRRTGVPQAAFCSNDHKLRLMDVGTQRFVNDFTYANAINCSATSPDGRVRALVGDCRDAYITDAERGHTLVKLHGHLDHGFACAWATNGVHVATGAQDGRTLVWDARKWSAAIQSLPSSMSCPRSLHFTDDNALVVAESDDVVSVYDAVTFKKRQDIRFFGSIAGLALLNGGAEMLVANADRTVGGLLTFQQTAQGRNQGTFGERVASLGSASRPAPSSRGWGTVSDICI